MEQLEGFKYDLGVQRHKKNLIIFAKFLIGR